MRLFFLTTALALASAPSFAQTCCDPIAKAYPKDEMKLLASTKEFQLLHAEPLPFTFVSRAGGEMTEFRTPDGKTGKGFLLKAKKKTDRYLFVFQEWWGLNDFIKQEAEKYFNSLGGQVNVLALDLYDGRVATAREEAGKLMSSADPARLESIVKGALGYAGPTARIATVGWCFGGMWSLKSAILAGKQAVGCVMYYGMPEKDVAKLKTLNTDVLGIFASQDRGITPEVVRQFEQNMAAAGEKVTVKMFEADHAFANPSNPKHDKAATEEAYQLSSTYLKKKLL